MKSKSKRILCNDLKYKSVILTEIHFPLRPKSIIFFSPLKIERLDILEVKLTQTVVEIRYM